MGTAIVITSGKGGTGKTTTAAAVASCLAALGKKTLCLAQGVFAVQGLCRGGAKRFAALLLISAFIRR